jgi:hypothetical protein
MPPLNDGGKKVLSVPSTAKLHLSPTLQKLPEDSAYPALPFYVFFL